MRVGIRIGAFALAMAMTSHALACSICRCGDPTFNALGSDGVAQTGFRAALDWDQVKKTQGNPSIESESLTEQRTTLLLAYGISDRLGLFLRLPYSDRSMDSAGENGAEHVHASGLADPEISGQVRLWSSPFEGDVGARTNVFAVAGVKTPWGENNVSRNGERLDEHVQPGTGSTDVFAGLAGSYQLNPRSALFASVQYRSTGRNAAGYRYGDIFLANAAYEHKIGIRWDAVLAGNYRNAGRDETDRLGTLDPDTGGTMFFVAPQLLFDAGHGWVLRASAQVPVTQSGLNGYQEEKTVWNLGITLLPWR
jgi:hypothetical protein